MSRIALLFLLTLVSFSPLAASIAPDNGASHSGDVRQGEALREGRIDQLQSNVDRIAAAQQGMDREIDGISKAQAAMRRDIESMTRSQAIMLEQISSLNENIKTLSSTSVNTLARVEILNASGIDGLGEWVARILASKDFAIFSIKDVAHADSRPTRIFYKGGAGKNAEIIRVQKAGLVTRKQTRILYTEGFIQRATRVGLALPGSQTILPDNALKNNAAIRVVVGSDMKILLKKHSS